MTDNVTELAQRVHDLEQVELVSLALCGVLIVVVVIAVIVLTFDIDHHRHKPDGSTK